MSIIGEAALSAFFDALFRKLASPDFQLATSKQVRNHIEKLEQTLKNIQAVLADAEEKQMQNKVVKRWLADLKDLAYDVDDILDEFATETLKQELIKQKHHQASTSKIKKFLASGTTFHPSTLMFDNKMMSKMKQITEELDALVARKDKLQLTENHNAERMIQQRPESSSLVNEDEVYGREQDKQKILDLVRSNDGSDGGISVIPIVGMGGIGKTTLAQLVYNDDSIKDHFDLKAWVCVSDQFDINRITHTVLLSLTSQSCDVKDLNFLQVKLKEQLSKKKFLLVLDDVWSDKYGDWKLLRGPFDAGLPGSKIIVTTRSSKVSSIMRTVSSDYSLEKLSDDDSLSLFAHHAIGGRDFSEYPDLKEIGTEIMKKCDGLPLAAKTVGGLLRNRLDREAWKDILESEIWNSPNGEIIPALWLSYYHLPSQLKQFFAYCSLVPKDYEFEQEEMVLFWMAEGLVPSEDLGRKCFEELVSRSFFQVSSMNRSKFVMHDLINDLAQSAAGEFFLRTEGGDELKFDGRTRSRHASYIAGRFDGLKRFEALSKAMHLRTFVPFTMSPSWLTENHLSNTVVTDLLPKLKRLRVLSLKKYYSITEIPESIGNLIHLRYLNFSDTEIKGLPNSICNLCNLQTLKLRGCRVIEKLPSRMGTLMNLCHLDIKGTSSMEDMPSGIGKLKNLQTLSKFIVGREGGLNIREMQHLSNLKGEISISDLQNVDEAQAAFEAALSSKPGIDTLELKWCPDFNQNSRKKDVEREVLKLLRPHEDLKVLTIMYYGGALFPTWVGHPSFKNLQSLKIVDCKNCTLLPAVGKLPLLKDLYICGMSSVICVGQEFYGENCQDVFPSLETLHFQDMPEWKEWNSFEVDDRGKKFPHLRKICTGRCPKLVGILLDDLPSLEELRIESCEELVVTISNLPMLRNVTIDGCKEVVFGSYTDLCSIEIIILRNISKIACRREEAMMPESVKVKHLQIKGCEELASLWQRKWGSLRTLEFENFGEAICIGAANGEETEAVLQIEIPCNTEDVRIAYCEKLEKLSKTFSNLMHLKVFSIVRCPKLVSISVGCLPPTLTNLNILECQNVQCLLDDGENINFSSISLLESLKVGRCFGLKSLSASGKLPATLRRLLIYYCPSLEAIAWEFGDNMYLENIQLYECENIKYLPRGLDKLHRLQDIQILHCPNVVCFPESGLPTTPTLKSLSLRGCEKLEALPSLHSLQLEELCIRECPTVESISLPQGSDGLCLPTTLSSLHIDFNFGKVVMQRGELLTLVSLRHLSINGSNCTDTVSFPENMKLPSSLVSLHSRTFENLRKLSSDGFQNLTSLQKLTIGGCPKLEALPQNLTSLQFLYIEDCPKLKSLPKEMLPSLLHLRIHNCPELRKLCKRDKEKLWSHISHIPSVQIDDY